MNYNRKTLCDFYKDVLQKDFMKFWRRAWDEKNGGVYTCFTDDGSKLLSKDKFIWSQGRYLWVLAHYVLMIDRGVIQDPDRDAYLAHAVKTYYFLREHAILSDDIGVCAYLTTEDGQPKEQIPGKGYYTSHFVDAFVIMGFAELARATKNIRYLDEALSLYDRTKRRMDSGKVVSEPFPQPKGYLVQANYMIFSNMTQVLYTAAEELGHKRYDGLVNDAQYYAKFILDKFYLPDLGLIREHIPLKKEDEDTFFVNYILPSHAVESMWFCRNIAVKTHFSQEYVDRIHQIIKNSINLGWDQEYGGILRVVGFDGKRPQGRRIGDPQEDLFSDTWDTKLWWTHTECLWATLLCYEDTEDHEFLEMYQKFHDYSFSVFPNPNREIGEWIQVRARDGKPVEKTVSLPVKDPYHCMRDFMLIIEKLSEKE